MRAILVLLIVGATVAFMFRKKNDDDDDDRNALDRQLEKDFQEAATIYPREVVQNAERIYRFTTRHFTEPWTEFSGSAAMDAFTPEYPFGWHELAKLWEKNPSLKPIKSSPLYPRENGMPLVVFPSLRAGIMTLCYFLTRHDNNPGRWLSLDPGEQMLYNEKIAAIAPAYV